jgi:hypothetical protein
MERTIRSEQREHVAIWKRRAPLWFSIAFFFFLSALGVLFASEGDDSLGSAIGVIVWACFAGLFGVLVIRELFVRGVL